MKKTFLTIALVVLLSGFSQSSNSGSAELKKIQDDYWKHQLEENLYLRLKFGLPVEKLPDVSYEGAKKKTAFSQSILDRLKKVDASGLNEEEQISYDILQWENSAAVDGLKYFWLTTPITPYASPINTMNRVFREFEFKNEKDAERYLSLLKQYTGIVQALHKHVEEQFNQGIVLPKEEIQLVVPFLKSNATDPGSSSLSVSEERLKSIPDAKEFRKNVEDILRSGLNPAFTGLATYIEGDYSRKARTNVGLAELPNGKEYYRYLVRFHTTMSVSPEDIHASGLKQMEQLNAEMEKIRNSLGFKGTKAEFHNYLKTDPQFFPKTPDEIATKFMEFISRIEPKISSYFMNVPKAPYGVRRLDPALEGSMTFGYYQTPIPSDPKGYYLFNGSNLNQRSLLGAGSLIYHELIPGHHFQICLQGENSSLHEFRRESFPTAYVEGWAEYTSTLAGEMGMYRDDYEKYGRVAMKAFLTNRLVVDTGMNLLGWPRSKAVEYMKENLLNSDSEIHTETLRYSSDIPGQALAYLMGANKIMELREKSRAELKDRFDIRQFHQTVLGSGAMPMTVLEKHVERYIQTAKTH
jgi:uncharacterized protein (DUF885 family)